VEITSKPYLSLSFTNLTGITCQIGKTGQATPVAIFDPIEIGGVTIARATLHNYQFVQENDIRIGDRIVISRANDVIPKVIKSFPELRKTDIPVVKFPERCPVCNAPIISDGPLAFCTGDNCPAQNVGRIIHYCSREAMDIEGMGETTVKVLYNAGIIKDIPDLYSLHLKTAEIARLEGFGQKKINKILKGIEESKIKPFSKLLYGLSIPHIGRTNSPAIADMAGNIDALICTSKDSLREISGIGEIMADAIVEFFSKEKNLMLISQLKNAGVNMVSLAKTKPVSDDLPLSGKIIVITGTLSIKRSEMEAIIRFHGGTPSNSVSKKTDYVILGPDQEGSSKHKNALKASVPIISEWDFIDILKANKDPLYNPYCLDEISQLKDAGVNMVAEKKEAGSTLTGKTFVITGTLSMKRSDVEKLIRDNGGKTTGSVSKNTDYVILGPDKTGTNKHKKALSLGIPIISENEFRKILRAG